MRLAFSDLTYPATLQNQHPYPHPPRGSALPLLMGRRAASTSASIQPQTDISMVFSMELQLGRTRCGKFDEDIDNCPLQGNPDLNNVRTVPAALRLGGCGCSLRAWGA